MVKKIALEEHFLDPATEPYWRPTMVDVAPQKTAQLYGALTDFGERRLASTGKSSFTAFRTMVNPETLTTQCISACN